MTAGRAERRAVAGARALIVPLCILLGGCFRFGPINLNIDQIDYSRAVAEGERAQVLLNIIRIRYGDTPTFINATQVISGYQLQRNVNGTFEVFPHAAASTFLGGGGSVQLQETPTFTFQPVGGEAFAQAFLRPLPPDQLLTLLLTAVPVDMLLGLTVQSIGSLQNARGFGATAREEAADFDRLLHDLRRLQLAGLIRIRLEETFGPDGKPLLIVASGSGTFRRGEERAPFQPGDFLFVAAGVPHRFEEFTDDFQTWVLFFGPALGG
jgi:hypothetical protein